MQYQQGGGTVGHSPLDSGALGQKERVTRRDLGGWQPVPYNLNNTLEHKHVPMDGPIGA